VNEVLQISLLFEEIEKEAKKDWTSWLKEGKLFQIREIPALQKEKNACYCGGCTTKISVSEL
jgi:hypothetical protein